MLFELRPSIQILISGAVRNAETFETFKNACGKLPKTLGFTSMSLADPCRLGRSKFTVQEIDFEAKPMREQIALFYATAVPLKILRISKPGSG